MYDWWFRFDVLLAVQRLGLGVVLCFSASKTSGSLLDPRTFSMCRVCACVLSKPFSSAQSVFFGDRSVAKNAECPSKCHSNSQCVQLPGGNGHLPRILHTQTKITFY